MSDDGTLGPAEAPQVTAATKFRRGGFKPAAEVIAEAEAAAVGGAPEAPPEETDELMNAAIAADDNLTFETPEGVTPLTQPQAEEEPEAEPKFKIGGKEFATQEEAWAYAEELEQNRIAADAFRQGVEAAASLPQSNPAPAAPAPESPQEIDPLYYTDPLAYHKKLRAEIVAEAKSAVRQEQTAEQTNAQTWNKFYQDNPELANSRDYVEYMLFTKNPQLLQLDTETGLRELAKKVKASLGPAVTAQMPKIVLPKVAATASPGGIPGVTPQKTQAKTLNFAQQIKQHKRGRVPPR